MNKQQLYAVRMLRPSTLVARTANGEARVDVPKMDEKGNNTIVKVRLDVARDWVSCGVAEALDVLPKE